MTRSLVFIAALMVAVPAAAGQRQGGAGPRQPARPAVDPLTASIQGRVTTADTGAPIRRAEVRAMSDAGVSRLVTTDGDGRFDLRDLPAGEFRVTASKSGFVSLTYGQQRPFEAPTPIDLTRGQRATANIALPRAGAIAGRILDEAGEPVAEAHVQAMRSRTIEGRRRLQPLGAFDTTDDTGAFRLYGLPPGEYYVSVGLPRTDGMAPRASDGRLGGRSSMTTFFPGTPNLEEAQPIVVGVGGEARADMQLFPMRAATVSGAVFRSNGAPAANAQISLRSASITLGAMSFLPGSVPLMISGDTGLDGTFALPGVPPGSYVLQANAPPDLVFVDGGRPSIEQRAPAEMAMLPLVVAGGDVTGVTMTTGAGGSIEGTFVRDTGVTRSLPSGLEIEARSVLPGGPTMMNHGATTFRLMGLTSPIYIRVNGLPDTWAVKAITLDGVDVTDRTIDVRNGQHAAARVVLTDRVTEVTGAVAPATLADATREKRDTTRYQVVVFPDDAAKWTYPSRYLRTVRADQQGIFIVRGLPGGERYLAVAVDHLEEGEDSDPQFLERMRDRATSFSLGEVERKSIDLRLIER
jgi:hypothetical protein